jgi:hypothetical protein
MWPRLALRWCLSCMVAFSESIISAGQEMWRLAFLAGCRCAHDEVERVTVYVCFRTDPSAPQSASSAMEARHALCMQGRVRIQPTVLTVHLSRCTLSAVVYNNAVPRGQHWNKLRRLVSTTVDRRKGLHRPLNARFGMARIRDHGYADRLARFTIVQVSALEAARFQPVGSASQLDLSGNSAQEDALKACPVPWPVRASRVLAASLLAISQPR